MKSKEKLEDYKKMEIKDLTKELGKIQDEVSRAILSGQKSKNTAKFKRNRRDIARIETLISQKVGEK